jgi:hypothetical protein
MRISGRGKIGYIYESGIGTGTGYVQTQTDSTRRCVLFLERGAGF